MRVAEPYADERSGITTARGEPVVPEHVAHQAQPELGRGRDPDARGAQRARERGTRQRRHDDVERVAGIAAEAAWVGQWSDEVLVVPEGPRPAVREEQRHRVGAVAALVDEMDRDAIE